MDPLLDDVTDDQRALARSLWQAAEALHAVVYFDPEVHREIAAAGTRGFWMGYFATRLAPLGPVGPEVATAVSFGFAPDRPARALPDAWTYVSPEVAIQVRQEAAARGLRRIVPALGHGTDEAHELAAASADLDALVAGLDPAGRPLGAANLALALPDDPVARLWQLCTTLREHRGDGHVAVLVAHGLDGCTANVLATAVHDQDPELLRNARTWSPEAWRAGVTRLAHRGLVTPAGGDGRAAVTEEGRALHRAVEDATDALAWRSYAPSLDEARVRALRDRLVPWAGAVFDSGLLPASNPIGLSPD
jgi:hypothetical protein